MNQFLSHTYEWAIKFGGVLVGLAVAVIGFIFFAAATLLVMGFILGFIGECAKSYRKWKAKRMLNKIDRQMKATGLAEINRQIQEKGFATIKVKDMPEPFKDKLNKIMNSMDDKMNRKEYNDSFDDIIARGLSKNNNGEKPN